MYGLSCGSADCLSSWQCQQQEAQVLTNGSKFACKPTEDRLGAALLCKVTLLTTSVQNWHIFG
jgi:hypothetical protein